MATLNRVRAAAWTVRKKIAHKETAVYDSTALKQKMQLTLTLLKKVKSKRIMVLMESVVSGHQFNTFRDRLADKLEVVRFDPYIQKESIYRERKRIRSA